MRQTQIKKRVLFMVFVLVSTLSFIGSVAVVEGYQINVKNDTNWPINFKCFYVLDGWLEQDSLSPGKTVYEKGFEGQCWSRIRITSQVGQGNSSIFLDQTFDIARCGNLGVVVKPGLNGMTIEKYPY